MGWWLEAHGRSTLPALKPRNTNTRAEFRVHVKLSQLLLFLTKIICSNIITSKTYGIKKETAREVSKL
jgi:hypothetical protein